MAETLDFPESDRERIDPYLPAPDGIAVNKAKSPFITLTYATSMDSHLAIRPGVQTALSGPESKAMTHYLRTRHDAILVGSGTAMADDPGLNSRLSGIGLDSQPRPIVLDRRGRWTDAVAESKVVRLAKEGKGKAPWLFIGGSIHVGMQKWLEKIGGQGIAVTQEVTFEDIVEYLQKQGIRSLMIEGGGTLINELLSKPGTRRLIDSVIVTVAPTYLGRGGVAVSPKHEFNAPEDPVVRFKDVYWMPLGQDIVMLGKVQ